MVLISFSPRWLGPTFLLNEKGRHKNQDPPNRGPLPPLAERSDSGVSQSAHGNLLCCLAFKEIIFSLKEAMYHFTIKHPLWKYNNQQFNKQQFSKSTSVTAVELPHEPLDAYEAKQQEEQPFQVYQVIEFF